jgi:hypothetical protein
MHKQIMLNYKRSKDVQYERKARKGKKNHAEEAILELKNSLRWEDDGGVIVEGAPVTLDGVRQPVI